MADALRAVPSVQEREESGSAAAGRRRDRWIEIVGGAAHWHTRLDWSGVNRAEALVALEGYHGPLKPSEADLADVLCNACEAARSLFTRDEPSEPEVAPFAHALLPFVRAGQELLEHTRSANGLKTDAPTKDLVRSLAVQLSATASWALDLDLGGWLMRSSGANRARDRGGDYRVYCRDLMRRYPRYFQTYPVLARLLCTCVLNWVRASQELLARLCRDADDIKDVFRLDPASIGLRVFPGWSDPHRGGRTTAVVSTGDLSVVYKPRPLRIDAAFSDFIRWFNSQGPSLELRAPRYLLRNEYGWMEYIADSACPEADAGAFFTRAGYLIALTQCLGAIDMHRENLVAAGAQPVLVDLETILHPALPASRNEQAAALGRARTILADSALRTGLLPVAFSRDDDDVDLSGFSADARDPEPLLASRSRSPHWAAINRQNQADPGARTPNCPRAPCGAPYRIRDFVHFVCNGIHEAGGILARERAGLAAPGGVLRSFAGARARVVLRPTLIYKRLAERAVHPRFLTSGLDRSIELEALARVHLKRAMPASSRLFFAEARAMEGLDVPIFTTLIGSLALDVEGDSRVDDFFEVSSLEHAARRIASRTDRDVEWDSRVAATLLRGRDDRPAILPMNLRHPLGPDRAEDQVGRALDAVGEELLLCGIQADDGGWAWIGPSSSGHGAPVTLRVLGHDLYSGVAGIALFLAVAGTYRGNDRMLAAARGAAATIRASHRARDHWDELSTGGHSGAAGVAFALACIGKLLQDNGIRETAVDIGTEIVTRTPADSLADAMDGAAGRVLGLLSLYELTSAPEWLERALQASVPLKEGPATWRSSEGVLLTGYSHGASGIAVALSRLFKATGEKWLLRLVRSALEFEHAHKLPDETGWRDLRPGMRHRLPMCAWCHGAAGIGLSRLTIREVQGVEAIAQADLEIALKATVRHATDPEPSLCCGEAGRAVFLFRAARVLQRQDLLENARGLLARITRCLEVVPNPEQARHLRPIRPLGLFQGLAGLGYSLLAATNTNLPDVFGMNP